MFAKTITQNNHVLLKYEHAEKFLIVTKKFWPYSKNQGCSHKDQPLNVATSFQLANKVSLS